MPCAGVVSTRVLPLAAPLLSRYLFLAAAHCHGGQQNVGEADACASDHLYLQCKCVLFVTPQLFVSWGLGLPWVSPSCMLRPCSAPITHGSVTSRTLLPSAEHGSLPTWAAHVCEQQALSPCPAGVEGEGHLPATVHSVTRANAP